jgi:DNA-binding response OmpR family regulator
VPATNRLPPRRLTLACASRLAEGPATGGGHCTFRPIPADMNYPSVRRAASRRASEDGEKRKMMLLRPKPMHARSVLLIESDRGLAELIDALLTGSGYDPIRAPDGAAAMEIAFRHAPDLVLLDMQRCGPGADGIELCRRLRSDPRGERVPLILLSSSDDEADRVLALEFGADDVVRVPFGNRELLARIKSLLRRSNPPAPQVLRRGEILIDVGRRRVEFRGNPVPLTPTEFRVLHYLAHSPDRVHSREEILGAVRADGPADATERSVDPHVNTIRRKLGQGGACIETIRGFGYRLK